MAAASFAAAIHLHTALRKLQAANAGLEDENEAARQGLNRLVDRLEVRPLVEAGGGVRLTSSDPANPVALLLVEVLEIMQSAPGDGSSSAGS